MSWLERLCMAMLGPVLPALIEPLLGEPYPPPWTLKDNTDEPTDQ